MKALMIEDDDYKAKDILDFMNSNYLDIEIERKISYQSGLKSIINCKFDFILLDMSLPRYDTCNGESVDEFETFAGREILSEMDRRNIKTKVIVITSFDVFGEDEYKIDGKQLNEILKKDYDDIYVDMVYYNPSLLNWKKMLMHKINNIIGR